jgi:hypothetical protein
MVTHQTDEVVHTDLPALGTQGRMHTRTAVDGAIVGMNATDIRGQGAIGPGPRAFWPAAPRGVAAGTRLQHAAHHPHREGRPVVLNEAEPDLGGPETMPMASFKMSRSICVRSRSRRSRRISTRSAEPAATASPVAVSAPGFAVPFAVPRPSTAYTRCPLIRGRFILTHQPEHGEKGITPCCQRRSRHTEGPRYQFRVLAPKQSQHRRGLALSRHPAAAAGRRCATLVWSLRAARPRSIVLALVHDSSPLADTVRL